MAAVSTAVISFAGSVVAGGQLAAMAQVVQARASVVSSGPAGSHGRTVAPSASGSQTTGTLTYVRTIGGQTTAVMYPSGVAVDASGNVYVSDTGNDKIEKYQAGTTNLLWSVGIRGAPIGPNGSFSAPRDLAVDATHVFVADTDNAVVQVLNASDGSYVQMIRTFGASLHFSDPIGISTGTDGSGHERVLVSDGVSGNVYVFDASMTWQLSIPPTNATEGTRDAATDSLGNIYTADYRGNAVDKYDSTDSTGATPLASWSGTGTNCKNVAKPYGVDVDTTDTPNRIYVASSNLEQVKVFDPSGNCLNVGGTGSNAIGAKATLPSDSTALFQLRRVAIGAGSNPLVYAADLWGLKILTYKSTDGTIATAQQPELGNGIYPAAGNLNKEATIALGGGFIFAINTVNQRVERFNIDGSSPISFGTKGVAESTAAFNWPQGIAFDAANGNIWVANTRNNRVDEFTTAGTPVTSYPPAGRLNSIFNWPMDVAFDPAGHMYVADTMNNRIAAFSVSGTTVTQLWTIGTRGTGSSQFIKPWGLTYDGTQNPARVLVTDTFNNRIVSLNATSGAWIGVLPIAKGTSPGQITLPQGITVDGTGKIWIADTGNDRIEQFTAAGTFANQMLGSYGTSGNAVFNAPQGMAFDTASGLLYVADTNNNRIQVYRPPSSGVPVFQRTIFNAGGVAPLYPAGGEADSGGVMYIADSGGSRIDKIDTLNHVTYITPSSGPLSNPRNLSVDIGDPTKLWITDTGSNSVIEMTTSGTVLATFNASSTFPLVLMSPFGNANDASNVYVADSYNHRVVAVAKSDGHTVWSAATCSVASPSALTRVRDVAIGTDGNIYAADTDANRIVVFNTSGSCLSSWTGAGALKAPRALTSDGVAGLWIVNNGNSPALLHFSNSGATLYGQSNDAGGFLAPEGVFLDGSNVVVADPFAFQVVTFTVTSGVPSATGVALNLGSPALGGFNNPFGVAFAPNGDMFVSDMFNQRIEKYSAGTGTWIASGHFGGASGNMQNPRGLSVTPDGLTLILTNSEDERIDLFNTSDLSFRTSIVPTCGKMFFPHQTAFDAVTGTYWIADTNNHRVIQVDGTGNCLQNWTIGGVLKAPRGIAWDGTNVWVADAQAGIVYRCTTAGSCTAVAKRIGTPTLVNGPWNMAVNNGALWIADQSAGKIVVMDLTGAPMFTFGSLGANPNLGQFVSVRSVAINPLNGSVAVADFGADLISIWQ